MLFSNIGNLQNSTFVVLYNDSSEITFSDRMFEDFHNAV